MITLMIAAAIAAQPAAAPAAAPAQQMPMMQMGDQREQQGQMAEMKDCCCHDMMAKMHEGHGSASHVGHEGHSGE